MTSDDPVKERKAFMLMEDSKAACIEWWQSRKSRDSLPKGRLIGPPLTARGDIGLAFGMESGTCTARSSRTVTGDLAASAGEAWRGSINAGMVGERGKLKSSESLACLGVSRSRTPGLEAGSLRLSDLSDLDLSIVCCEVDLRGETLVPEWLLGGRGSGRSARLLGLFDSTASVDLARGGLTGADMRLIDDATALAYALASLTPTPFGRGGVGTGAGAGGEPGDGRAVFVDASPRVIVFELLVAERRALISGRPCLSYRYPFVSRGALEDDAMICIVVCCRNGDTVVSSAGDNLTHLETMTRASESRHCPFAGWAEYDYSSSPLSNPRGVCLLSSLHAAGYGCLAG